jgi:hypothetical protein
MNSTWKMFFWAMLSHPEFRHCYINLPITLELRSFKDWRGRGFAASLHFKVPSPYVPWSVRDAYFEANNLYNPGPDFDDIPF